MPSKIASNLIPIGLLVLAVGAFFMMGATCAGERRRWRALASWTKVLAAIAVLLALGMGLSSAAVGYRDGLRDAALYAAVFAGGSLGVSLLGFGAGAAGYRPGRASEAVLGVVARAIGFREDR